MNKILHIHFVCIIVAVLFVGVGFAVGQTVLNLLRFGFSINNTGITNLVAVR
jgi:hypothetical protein